MKKGFTLVEMIAILVILSLLSLILTPVILDVVRNSRKASYKDSVLGIMTSAANYISQYDLVSDGEELVYPIEFTCDGTFCKASYNKKLEFTGEVPTGGSIIMYDDNTVVASYVTNGIFCAYGNKSNIVVGMNCDEVDSTKPVIRGTQNGKIITLVMTDDKSGIDSYCATTDIDNCSWVIPTNPDLEMYEVPSAGTWYFFAKDKNGNISDSISFVVPISLFNYDATDTTYAASYACSNGRTLSNGNCTYYYSSNSSQCGTEDCNCSCNSWYCLDKGKCHAYDPSGNGQCINWDAEWCNVNACGSQSCSTCAKSCTKTENQYRYYACNTGDVEINGTCHHYTCPDGGTLDGTICRR